MALQAVVAIFLSGAVIIILLFDGTVNPTPPWRDSRSLRIEIIEPGQRLDSSLLSSHLSYNPFPDTRGLMCETQYDQNTNQWVEMGTSVPLDSRLATNNNFQPRVSYSKLNVLVVGDSIGENIAFFLSEAHGLGQADREQLVIEKNLDGKNQSKLWMTASRDGGYVAFAR